MATNKDIGRLLERCEDNGLGGKRTDEEMGRLVNEWLEVLGGCNTKLLDAALTEYLANDTRTYARLPKSGELLQIYNNLLDEKLRKNSLNYDGKCPWCRGGGKALLDYAEPFWGNYMGLGISCPCRHNGEAQALQNGLHVTRRVKPGYLEIWLDGHRLLGRLKDLGQKEHAKVGPPKQQSLKPVFEGGLTSDDLPF